ncbi:hypothetical protein [Flavobacterium restrictum]|uniref:DUF4468 domain-containing protein n=1 Tax=Flavobacterium restrictum TaxID=2594428 RepID=A0A553DQ51_9FLAO|nr:hypothetical protein [Flavobacterium restrictum]TRX34922.1 hypothetical protein FNW21_15735 [Flavobacterium restrictum]
MKKILFSTVSIFMFCSFLSAQNSSPTTETEYNYITKGYKVQISSGLDMKAGYEVIDISTEKMGTYTYEIKALVRSEKQEISSIMVITTSASWGNKYYFCIPHGDKNLNQKYYNDLILWDKEITTPYAYFMSSKYGEVLSQIVELEKKLKK